MPLQKVLNIFHSLLDYERRDSELEWTYYTHHKRMKKLSGYSSQVTWNFKVELKKNWTGIDTEECLSVISDDRDEMWAFE